MDDEPENEPAAPGRHPESGRNNGSKKILSKDTRRVTSRQFARVQTISIGGRGWTARSEQEAINHCREFLSFVEATGHSEVLLAMNLKTMAEACALAQMLAAGCFTANGRN
jgi:hypothetical protein